MDVPIRDKRPRKRGPSALATTVAIALAVAVALVAAVAAYLSAKGNDSGRAVSSDPYAALQRLTSDGDQALRFDEEHGYLRSLLDELDVPVESQMLVYSKTSLQSPRINPGNPRAIYFNDDLAVAWVPGGFIEIAAFDPDSGAQFWILPQTAGPNPSFQRDNRCAGCHHSNDALGTTGFLVRSIPTAVDGSTLPWLGNAVPSHATPIEERWGGWYVTGDPGTTRHLGNARLDNPRASRLPEAPPAVLEDLAGQLDTTRYLSPYSDVVALLVFNHQIRMMNLLLRLGEEARAASADGRQASALDEIADRAVDYMLFVDEAELGAVRGTSGFSERFSALGPRDRHGRSLRELELDGRLMRYPLSYMIHSGAFDGLPAIAKEAVYARLWQVLSGEDTDPRYARLSASDREAIIEILVDTKPDLPEFFRGPGA